MSRAYLQAPPQIQRRVDAVLFCLLAGGILVFWLHGDVMVTSIWDWSALARAFFRIDAITGSMHIGPLGIGLVNTLRIILWTLVPALMFGLCLGLALTSSARWVAMAAKVLVALTRNLPPLVFIFIVHYFFSSLLFAAINWNWLTPLPGSDLFLPEPSRMAAFFSAVITLSLYEGSYIAGIVRAGIGSVPKGQREAAASLGLNSLQCMRLVILPQAFRFMLPPLTGQMAALIKNTAIVSVISVQELTFQGLEFMTSSGLTGEVWVAVVFCYFVLCFAASQAGRWMEKRLLWRR